MKYEWKKLEKEIYAPKEKAELVNVPKTKYVCIKGKGNPNEEDYSNRIGALYAISYAIRMMPKNGYTPEGYFEYTVYPLEGTYELTEEGKQSPTLQKDQLLYTLMIKQPNFVTEDIFKKALEIAKKKKKNPLLEEVYFAIEEVESVVQILHVGSYDEEPESFAKMQDFLEENHFERKTEVHREIYLNDQRKVTPDKLKTILRYTIK